MAEEMAYIDISDDPDLLRIAEEVRTTRRPRMLRRNGEDMAILMPVKPNREPQTKRRKTETDFEAFRSSAGSWKDVDTDTPENLS